MPLVLPGFRFAEAVLEEVYHYQFRRSEAWGIQRLYRADGSRDKARPGRILSEHRFDRLLSRPGARDVDVVNIGFQVVIRHGN